MVYSVLGGHDKCQVLTAIVPYGVLAGYRDEKPILRSLPVSFLELGRRNRVLRGEDWVRATQLLCCAWCAYDETFARQENDQAGAKQHQDDRRRLRRGRADR